MRAAGQSAPLPSRPVTAVPPGACDTMGHALRAVYIAGEKPLPTDLQRLLDRLH